MTIRPELIDELLEGYTNPQDMIGESGLLKQLTKAIVERCARKRDECPSGSPRLSRDGQSQE